MGVDKTGPYGLTEEEEKQELLSASMKENPYELYSENYHMWREGYFRAWKVMDDYFAKLCEERP